MEQKQRLFIYDRKEMGVLILLGLMVALFAFTLGVHLGKRVGPRGMSSGPAETVPVDTVNDKYPNRQELTEQSKGVGQAIDESMNQALHDEVARTGVKLDTPRQVELPENARSKNAGATSPATGAAPTAEAALPAVKVSKDSGKLSPLDSIPAALRPVPHGKYTLQVGSHQTVQEARDQTEALEAIGMKPYLRMVDLKKKGQWYRVYLGGFDTKEEAEDAGARYKAKNMIESFMISNHLEE